MSLVIDLDDASVKKRSWWSSWSFYWAKY